MKPLLLIKKRVSSGADGAVSRQPPWGGCAWAHRQTSAGHSEAWKAQLRLQAAGGKASGPCGPFDGGLSSTSEQGQPGWGGAGSEALARVNDSDPRVGLRW